MPKQTVEERIRYRFKSKKLRDEALCHTSYANEKHVRSNERMEFLGDAVLQLIVSDHLFANFPDLDEGGYTLARKSCVSTTALAETVRRLGIEQFLKTGSSFKKSDTLHDGMLADFFEALVCAVFLDGGYKPAKKFVLFSLKPLLSDAAEPSNQKDAKSALLELAQKERAAMRFINISQSGPEHDLTYVFGVEYGGKLIAEGTGKDKKAAQTAAAAKALKILGDAKAKKKKK